MINRRIVMTAALGAVAAQASARKVLAQASISRITAYAFSFPALAGRDIRLADFAGHPLIAAAMDRVS